MWIIVIIALLLSLALVCIFTMLRIPVSYRWCIVIACAVIGAVLLLASSNKAIPLFHFLGINTTEDKIVFKAGSAAPLEVTIDVGMLRRGMYAVCIEAASNAEVEKMLRLQPAVIREYVDGVLVATVSRDKPMAKIHAKPDRPGFSVIHTFAAGGVFGETKMVSIQFRADDGVLVTLMSSPIP